MRQRKTELRSASAPELNRQAWQAVGSRPREALQLALRAQELALRGADPLERARALRTIGAARLELSELAGVAGPLSEAKWLLAALPGRNLEALHVSRLLSRHAFLEREYESALEHIHDALALASEDVPVDERATVLNDAGTIYAQIGHYQQGLDYLLASQTLLDGSGSDASPSPLNNIGQIYMLQGEPAKALEYFERASSTAAAQGSARIQIITLSNCGRALAELGDQDRSLQRHREAVALARAEGFYTYLPAALSKYAVVLSAVGRREEAFAVFEEARRIQEEHDAPFRDELLLALGGVLLEHGDPQRAEESFREAARIAEEKGGDVQAAGAYEGLSRALAAVGRWEEALEAHHTFHELSAREQKATLSTQTHALLLHHEIERAQREKELLRDMNRELSAAYDRLQQLNTELEAKSLELERLSVEDHLTKVFNRRHLERRLGEHAPLHVTDAPYSLVMADIDDFKSINDRFGHTTGDEILVSFADILRATTRRSDVVARVGGEEFILLLPGTSLPDAVKVAEKVRRAVAEYPWGERHPGLRVTVSCGVSQARPGGTPAAVSGEALSEADRQLHVAKRSGKNRVCADLPVPETGPVRVPLQP